jgi:DNA-binding GntR family transcriptional regulator
LLVAEGLVAFHPHRCAAVAEVSAEEVADVYAVRAALEGTALDL